MANPRAGEAAAAADRRSQCRDHVEGATRRQKLVSPAIPCRQRDSFLRLVHQESVLAVKASPALSASRHFAELVGSNRDGGTARRHHRVCRFHGSTSSLLASWLVLVPGHARSYAGYRTSRCTGDGRPLCVHVVYRAVPDDLLGCSGLGGGKEFAGGI